MISVEEIKKNDKIKNKKKKECYLKILELINNKIIIISKTNQKYVWFEIPLFMIGYPKYDINHCSEYLIKQIKKNNFIVNFFLPNILIINW